MLRDSDIDLMAISETHLDATVRQDRNQHCGGLLIYAAGKFENEKKKRSRLQTHQKTDEETISHGESDCGVEVDTSIPSLTSGCPPQISQLHS